MGGENPLRREYSRIYQYNEVVIVNMDMNITHTRGQSGLFYVSLAWLVTIGVAFLVAVLRGLSPTELGPMVLGAAVPGVLTLGFSRFSKYEWVQIIVLFSWLVLAIIACLSIAFIPMAALFMCAPAAASLFQRERVFEAMVLSAIMAALIYYARQAGFDTGLDTMSDNQKDWGIMAGLVGTIAFLIMSYIWAAQPYETLNASSLNTHLHEEETAGTVLNLHAHDGDKTTRMLVENFPAPAMLISLSDYDVLAVSKGVETYHDPVKPEGLPALEDIFDQAHETVISLLSSPHHSESEDVESDNSTQNEHVNLRRRDGADEMVALTSLPLSDETAILTFMPTPLISAKGAAFADVAGATFDGAEHDAQNRVKDLEKISEEKTLFFAGVGHELRTPLNAIIGFSDMMRSRLFGPLPGKYAEYADLIHDSGQHMLDLIGDVLDLSKIELGKYELHYDDFDAVDVIRSSVKMIRPSSDAAEVQISIDIDPSESLNMTADRRALRQILLNLLSNAIKFTPKGGHVGVNVKRVGDVMNISVSDDGVGIAADDIKSLGRPFSQASNARKTEARGSGLGLALVKSLIEQHGGRFVLASQEGQGTTADVYIPIRPLTQENDKL